MLSIKTIETNLKPQGFQPNDIDRLVQRLTLSVIRVGSCAEWIGAANSEGYGYIYFNKSSWRLSRLIWTAMNGKIPKGKIVCHSCDNPPCIDPNHLFLGTKGSNNTDRAQKGRNRDQDGENNSSSKLTSAQVRLIKTLVAQGVPRKEIAAVHEISRQTIDLIVNRKRWASII